MVQGTVIKYHEGELDSNFLNNCYTFKVFPKFLFFKIHNTSTRDNLAIRKRLLKRCFNKTDKRA